MGGTEGSRDRKWSYWSVYSVYLCTYIQGDPDNIAGSSIIFDFNTQKHKRFNTKNIIGIILGDPDGWSTIVAAYLCTLTNCQSIWITLYDANNVFGVEPFMFLSVKIKNDWRTGTSVVDLVISVCIKYSIILVNFYK